MGGAVRTLAKRKALSRFPYETLYVTLLIGLAMALVAWVAYELI
jgi:hypothetical protein